MDCGPRSRRWRGRRAHCSRRHAGAGGRKPSELHRPVPETQASSGSKNIAEDKAMTIVLKEKRMPDEPGVYLMKDGEGKIIYVGKAKNLKKRVTSYFTR